MTERILRKLPANIAIGFMDDCLIKSPTLNDHFDHLDKVIQAYRDAGLKLSPKKCHFFASELDYLGHKIDARGVRPTDDHVKAIKDWPLPKYKTDARSFLGVTGYYRRHVARYSELAKPWTAVVGKSADPNEEKAALKVTPEMVQSFEALKKALTSAPVLGYPYFKGPKAGRFCLDTDFSRNQVGAVLSQRQGPNKEVVIAYGSKKLNSTQSNWPSTKGELYAGIFFMEKYAYYLKYGPEFLWRTDNQALKAVKTLNCPSGIVQRWLGTLADFNFVVEHRAGIDHRNADGLSRSAAAEAADENDPRMDAIRSLPAKHLFHHTKDEMKLLQEQDEGLGIIRKWVKSSHEPSREDIRALSLHGQHYAGILESLEFDRAGVLQYTPPNQGILPVKSVTCLPQALWNDTIKLAHITGGHMGIDITLTRLRAAVHFPRMRAEVSDYIRTCFQCQQKSHQQPNQKHTLRSVAVGYPWQRIHIDHWGPLAPSRRSGATNLLTAKCAFSKWVTAIPVKDMTAETTLRALEKDIFSVFGYPDEIHSDMAPGFTSALFRLVNEELGIRVTTTTGYNPKGNSEIERVHRDLANILRATLEEDPPGWEDALPAALFALRTAVHSSTGLSPYQILFGRDVSQPLDLIFGEPADYKLEAPHDTDRQKYAAALKNRIAQAQEYVRRNMAKAVARRRRLYHQQRKSFLPGTKVWLFTPKTKVGEPRKTATYYQGPFVILNDNPPGNVQFRIAPHPSWTEGCKKYKESIVVTIDRLKLYKQGPPTTPGDDDDILMQDDEHAERIDIRPAAPRAPLAQPQQPPPVAQPPLPQQPLPPAGPPAQPPPRQQRPPPQPERRPPHQPLRRRPPQQRQVPAEELARQQRAERQRLERAERTARRQQQRQNLELVNAEGGRSPPHRDATPPPDERTLRQLDRERQQATARQRVQQRRRSLEPQVAEFVPEEDDSSDEYYEFPPDD